MFDNIFISVEEKISKVFYPLTSTTNPTTNLPSIRIKIKPAHIESLDKGYNLIFLTEENQKIIIEPNYQMAAKDTTKRT